MAVVVTGLAATLAASGRAESDHSTLERPRGVVEDCSGVGGPVARPSDFARPRNLVVGPFALLLGAGRMLAYVPDVGGNKIAVRVKRGHRVTLELPSQVRPDVGLVFGKFASANVTPRQARRVVTFKACTRGESTALWDVDLPVSGWVGGLVATAPQCVPLLIWLDDESSPRRAVIRFGVTNC